MIDVEIWVTGWKDVGRGEGSETIGDKIERWRFTVQNNTVYIFIITIMFKISKKFSRSPVNTTFERDPVIFHFINKVGLPKTEWLMTRFKGRDFYWLGVPWGRLNGLDGQLVYGGLSKLKLWSNSTQVVLSFFNNYVSPQ